MAEEPNDTEYSIVVPKFSNDQRKIKTSQVREIAEDMSKRFGGVTVNPSVLGCWKPDEGKELVCEENVKMSSVRGNASQSQKQADEEFVHDLAKEIGKEYGQASVMVSEDVVESDFVEGDYRKRLSDEKVGRKPFDEMI